MVMSKSPSGHPKGILALCSWLCPKRRPGILKAFWLSAHGYVQGSSGHPKGILVLCTWPCPKYRLGILRTVWLCAHGYVQSTVRAFQWHCCSLPWLFPKHRTGILKAFGLCHVQRDAFSKCHDVCICIRNSHVYTYIALT